MPSQDGVDRAPILTVDALPATENQRSGRILPAVLFFLTCVTTILAGFLLHLQFTASTQTEFSAGLTSAIYNPLEILNGIPFAATILLILLAHEMGHYLTCRYYGIRATLPYVIPAPPPIVPFGTFGAVIKIKSLFRDRRQLFDVGIAGPLAGFIVIIPALVVGLLASTEYQVVDDLGPTLEFGEPLLFQFMANWVFSGETLNINLHPIGWAAWFGMLATSLNLLPIGQLDGGHVVYSIFGERGHRIVSYVTFISLILLSLYAWPMAGYLVFAVLLLFLGFRHPRPFLDAPILTPERYLVALAGLIIFTLTFIPVPVRLVEHVGSL